MSTSNKDPLSDSCPEPSPLSKWRGERRILWTRLLKSSKNPRQLVMFCNFRSNNGFRFAECRKQTRLPIAEKNVRKCHFIRSHVTKYSKYFAGFDHECLRPASHFENRKHPGYELGSRSASLKGWQLQDGSYLFYCQPAGVFWG